MIDPSVDQFSCGILITKSTIIKQAVAKKDILRNIVMKKPVSEALEDFLGLDLNFLSTNIEYLNRMNMSIGISIVMKGK